MEMFAAEMVDLAQIPQDTTSDSLLTSVSISSLNALLAIKVL